MSNPSSRPLSDRRKTRRSYSALDASSDPIDANVSPSAQSVSSSRVSKTFGRVYTPNRIVTMILDLADYRGAKIVGRHVIDNSCGDGAFLTQIVERYSEVCGARTLKRNLETFVHGVELDPDERGKCVANLDKIALKHGLTGVRWDVVCGDALTIDRFDGKMDYVLGNPPYIRVHNLGASFERVRKLQFAQGGMTDLYLAFYEIGLKMLNPRGVLGYITPSSFFTSVAGAPLREYLAANNCLEKIVDLGHYQAFEATAYTAIAVLKKDRSIPTTEAYRYDGELHSIGALTLDDFRIDGRFYFAAKSDLNILRETLALGSQSDRFAVKNGFATLADSFFIGDSLGFTRTIPVVKASTGKWTRCLFPYEDAKLVPFDVLAQDKALKEYYEKHADALKKRSLTDPKEWYGFGRTQGIKDAAKPKIAINNLIRNANDIKLEFCPAGSGVYGGLYILSDLSLDEIKSYVCNADFVRYVSLLKKYKSGGYFTYSSKDLKTYLEYAYVKRRGNGKQQDKTPKQYDAPKRQTK